MSTHDHRGSVASANAEQDMSAKLLDLAEASVAADLATVPIETSSPECVDAAAFADWDSVPAEYRVGDTKTYTTYFQAFVGAGVLFLPSAFKSGGVALSLCTMALITFLSTICMIKMVECKRRLVADFKSGYFHGLADPRQVISYGTLGYVSLGSEWGRWTVDISIGVSQLLFSTAYLIFVSKNLHEIVFQLGNCESSADISSTAFIWMMFPFLVPLMCIRQLSKFSIAIIIADTCMMGGLVYLYASNIAHLGQHGVGPGIVQFDAVGFWTFLGTALFALDGTVFVLPIEHAMETPASFHRITYVSGFGIGLLYMSFGLIGYLAFGSDVEAIILLNLKKENPHSVPAVLLQLAYCLALFLAIPLIMFPVVRLVENQLVPVLHDSSTGDKIVTAAQTWKKNTLRILLTLVCAAIATFAGSNFDNFVSLIGGLVSVHLTLTFPAWFHLKICGDTLARADKAINFVCVAAGCIGTLACTAVTIYQWTHASGNATNTCTRQ